jgi:long-chain acyl-CoA synthetase
MQRQSLLDYIEIFRSHGEECAYVQREGYRTVRWSYSEVVDTAFRFARELENREIQRGEAILLWGPNRAEWVAVFLGCLLRGVVVIPMDDIASPDFAARVAAFSSVRLAVISEQHSIPGVPSLRLEGLQREIGQNPATTSPVELGPDDHLEIVFTSGTTAEPKGVVITHGNVLSNVEPLEREIRKYLKYEWLVHPIRFLNLLPLSHVFGQFLGIFLPPFLAGTVVFQDERKPAEIVSCIKRERVSVLVAVPRILQALKGQIEREVESEGSLDDFRRSLSVSDSKHFLLRWWIFRKIRRKMGWKFWAFISGGAALDFETEKFWATLGYAVIQGYGLTETTSLVSVNHPFRLSKGSIGKVLAGREIKLAPDGEILVRGGGVAAGYWKGSGPLSDLGSDEGWYRTGDLGDLDAEGNLYFKGRKKDVIVTPSGMNVYPEDLEAALKQQPEVKDCVVVPVQSGGSTRTDPCAALILADSDHGQSVAARAVGNANQLLAEYQKIRLWFVWPDPDFPRSSTQKPLRQAVSDAAQARIQKGDSPQRESNQLKQLISDVTHTPLPAGNASHPVDLNLSSLDRVELVNAIEDRYQVDLGDVSFEKLNTLEDVESLLRQPRSSAARFHYPRWALRWPVSWIRILSNYLLLRPAVFLLARPKIVGRERLANFKGPTLVICNHIGHVDVGLVIAALPHVLGNRLATATGGEALEGLRNPPPGRSLPGRIYDRLGWILGVSLLNLFPLPRESGFRRSFTYAGECTDRGYSVLIFPEGRHTEDGNLLPFRVGAGILAANLGIPVIPVRIDGLFAVKQSSRKAARKGEVQITIGSPLHYSGKPEEIVAQMRQSIEQL